MAGKFLPAGKKEKARSSGVSERRGLILLFRIIPKGLLSRLFGYAARMRLPAGMLGRIIHWFCGKYGVNREEIQIPEGGFKSLDHFFTRTLKDGVHIIDPDPLSVVSPVDARIDQYGPIRDTSIMQAKGIDYSLEGLIPSETHRRFIKGSFITLYLSPADYHRIHAPAAGRVSGYYIIPGKLFTVQEFMVRGLPGLFSRNERSITFIETGRGPVAVCKIGAMNVGRISLSYCDAVTNRFFRRRREVHFGDGMDIRVGKGDELGIFHLGSTVILLFPEGMVDFLDLPEGEKIRLGRPIAKFRR